MFRNLGIFVTLLLLAFSMSFCIMEPYDEIEGLTDSTMPVRFDLNAFNESSLSVGSVDADSIDADEDGSYDGIDITDDEIIDLYFVFDEDGYLEGLSEEDDDTTDYPIVYDKDTGTLFFYNDATDPMTEVVIITDEDGVVQGLDIDGDGTLDREITVGGQPTTEATDFTVELDGGQPSLSWTNSTDENFDHVVIIRKAGSAPTGISDGTEVYSDSGTTFTDTESLTEGTYYYTLYTCNASDNCTETGVTMNIILDTTAPTTEASGFSAAQNGASIDLSWTNPSGDADFDHVSVIVKQGSAPSDASDGTEIYKGTDESYAYTIPADGDYYFVIYACDAFENCTNTGVSDSVSGADITAPAVVTGETFTAGHEFVEIDWTDPADADFAGVKILRKTTDDISGPDDAGATVVCDPCSAPFTDTGLTNDTPYYYMMYTYDAVPNYNTGTSGTTTPYQTGPGTTQLAKILASDKAVDDHFGAAVSISGDYAIVGAHQNDDAGDGSGSAYIFHRTGTDTWDAGTKIVASDEAANDYFGQAVSISGDYAIVGARENDDAGSKSGSAYIFHRTGTNTWDTGTKIVASDAAADDEFGHSVAISGDYAIVGAYKDDDGGSLSGSAYIFHRTGTNTWDTGTKIVASDAEASDYFGQAVSISGDYAIVGADYNDPDGACYIFHRTGTNTWDTGTKIVPSDTAASGMNFGHSVSISGDYAIVGAFDDDDAGASSGSAYIFHRTGTNTWDTGTKIVASDAAGEDYFGFTVSISGDYAIVGARNNDDVGSNSGSAYLFQRTGTTTWDTGTIILATDAAADDLFGMAVSIDGDYAIVGANGDDTDTGAAYLY